MWTAQLTVCPPPALDDDIREYRGKIVEARRKIQAVKAEKKELLAFKLSHQGMFAELKGLNDHLADL